MELEDFDNRVSEHTAKVSDTLLPDYVAQDHANVLSRWHAAFTELTRIRRVVLPGKRKEFRLSANDIPHGARLWRNFLSLMLSNAWLEQRNREIRTIADGLDAVVVDAEDYRVAYEVFAEACARSVVNLGDTHRKILNAVYELETADKGGKARGAGFSLRAIAKQAGISPETVRNNRAFLTQSVSLLRDLENGNLSLVKDAEPSWWQTTNLLKGFPRPDEVKVWWEALKPVDTVDTHRSEGEKPIDKPDKASSEVVDTLPEVSSASDGRPGDNQPLDTTPEVSSGVMDTEKPIDTPNAVEKTGVSSVSSALEGELEKVFEPEGGDLHLDYDFIDSEDE